MKVVAFETEPHEAGLLAGLEARHAVRLVEEPLRAANAARFADAEIISTFLHSSLDRRVLERLAALRLIATRSTGFDHIDLAYCRARGIVVSNVPSYGEATVAEHVFALLLTISHRMREAAERARNGPFSPRGLAGFDLAGKTLGVVGTGRIGRHVVRIARGFDMTVVACDAAPDAWLARRLGFRYAALDAVLATADIVTLHVPATRQTDGLIDGRALARMKPGAVLINTARGSLVDPHALIAALNDGRLAAAGLDVLPDEPGIREEAELICSIYCDRHDLKSLAASHVLLRMPNVVVTPHSAFNTREAVARIAGTTRDNIAAFLEGHPQNVVAAAPPGAAPA
ncbi:hydroxyacid dehydrogenase [Aquibium sp. A9E412]|uniref:hydroxyacid dehydrogenase n=1 Tax=Aquibium sp. A9E412 TaxID=2976767 RepID=UPI0025AEDE38|nr:hydroxyacid dehydrogenase [Aquibium sp. A9E412]MDN2565551.1 hydroxyacid dehydrogenase [Aquibium sp. A9E412]